MVLVHLHINLARMLPVLYRRLLTLPVLYRRLLTLPVLYRRSLHFFPVHAFAIPSSSIRQQHRCYLSLAPPHR
jgi:hypothetical protein